MHYTLNQLKIFNKIAECESITKASEALFLTQPAVSIQLKKFQEQFSIPLTEVIGRKLYVTDFGREIAEAVKNILAEVDKIEYKENMHHGFLTGKLTLSIVSTAKYVMPYFLAGFTNKYPAVELKMDVTNKSNVITSLEKNEVDFSLISILPEKLNLNKIDLLQNKLYLVGKSRETKKKLNSRKLFNEQPIIFREEGSATRNLMEKYLQANNLSVKKSITLTSNEAVKQAVIAGMGYSIMPLIGIRNEIRNGELEIIPLKGLPLITQWNLVWLTDKKLSPVAEGFRQYLIENVSKVVEHEFLWYEQYQ